MQESNETLQKLKKEYQSIPVPKELHQRLMETMEENRPKKRRPSLSPTKYFGASVAAAFLCLVIVTNTSAAAAEFLEKIPVIGSIVRIVTFHSFTETEEHREAEVETPVITGLRDSVLEDSLNAQFHQYADSLIAEYKKDIASVDGTGSLSSSYEVIADDEYKLVIGINAVFTQASSNQINQYYTIDKGTGEIITLKDLFQDGADYITPISGAIIKQMEKDGKKEEVFPYYLAKNGDMDGFETISPTQSFYLTEENNLVISFNAYEVAPGYMGAVTFTIPNDVIAPLVDKDSLLGRPLTD